jgi:hypothetical protein
MAETIGRAYIKILADGTGLSESIRKEMDKGDIDKAAEEGGRDFSKSYAKGYEDEERKSKNFSKSLSRNLDKGFHQINEEAGRAGARSGALFGDRLALNLEHRIKESFPDLEKIAGDLGERMGDSMRKDFIRTGNFTKSFDAYLQKALKDHARFEAQINKDHAAALRINHDLDVKAEQDRQRLENTINRNHAQAIRMNLAIDQKAEDERMRMLRIHAQALRLNAAREKKIDEDRRKHGSALIKTLSEVGDAVGRSFGKGSRNNFVNAFGSIVGSLASLPASLAKTALKVKDFGEKIGTTFTDAGGGIEGFLAAGGQIATKIGPVIAGLAAFAAVVAGPIVSALWLLLGAVAALASSITFGLIGALAPLVGLLGPIALAAGAVAAALIGMDDKTKKLMKEAIAPLKQDLKDLGDAARPGILDGLQVAAKNLHGPIQQLEPVFASAGDGIATFMGAFTEGATGPGFNKFVNVMTVRLPHILGKIGDIAGHFMDGLFGVFAVLNKKGGPVDTFLDGLDKLAKKFDEWSNKKGPKGAGKFFDDAADSAGALMDVISPLWDILTQVMGAGKPHGDSLLTSLGDQLRTLSDWMKEHPDDVEQWMQDSEDFARALGDLAVAVIQIADALDTPGGRKVAIFLVKMAALTLGPATASLQALAFVMGQLGSVPWDKIGSGLDGVAKAVGRFQNMKIKINWGGLLGAPGALQDKVESIVVRAFAGAAGWARKAMGKVDLSKIMEGVTKIGGVIQRAFVGGWKIAFNAMGKVDLTHIIEGAGRIGGVIADAFRGGARKALDAMGKLDLTDIITGAENVASAILGPFYGLGSRILSAIGHIDIASLMHGSIKVAGKTISWAEGGLVLNPTFGLAGEAGPEAIVPLNRPLHMVDPAVRELSAIAQGLRAPRSSAAAQKVIDVGGISIITPTKDPAAVAQETINRLVAVGY